MISDAIMPRPGAANGVVPKKGIGIAFWIAGVPGRADIVKVEVPSAIAAGIRRRGMSAARNSGLRHRRQHEEGDEQADAAIGDEGAGQHDRQDGAARPEPLGHEVGRSPATEPLSSISLPNSAPSRNSGKNCARNCAALRMNVCVQCASSGSPEKPGSNQRHRRRQQQDAPAAVGKPDQQREGEEDARGDPTPQHSASSASMSTVERCPRSSPCSRRNSSAARRPSSRSMQRKARSPFSFEE